MSDRPIPVPPLPGKAPVEAVSAAATPGLWERITTWASEHKALVYTVAGVTLLVTAGGVIYYVNDSNKAAKPSESPSGKRKNKKDRKKAKKEVEDAQKKEAESETKKPTATVESDDELPEITEELVATLSEQAGPSQSRRRSDADIVPKERKDYAAKLKAAGNKAYGSKAYNDAIELYTKALMCRQDPVFYSNRAACWNAMGDWEKVIEDTTAAINLDNEYVKALNRRANAYEQVERYSEALLDYTASCIIDGFRNEQNAQSVERLLKKVAEAKGKAILEKKQKKLPSPTFVSNYLQSFRQKPLPEGLDEDLDEESGKGQLRKGLLALNRKTSDGYNEADQAFNLALKLGDLGEFEALAYNMRGTFRYLIGQNDEALADLDKSVQLDPSLTQSYVKRASMHLERGDQQAAAEDFEEAQKQNDQDPDIFYHRAQLHFILNEFAEAAKDYQKSIDLDKDFVFSHIQLGVTQYKMGSIASSMATFRRCIKNFDKIPDVYNYYGELLLDQQKYQEAIEKFDLAVDMEKTTKPLGMNVLPLINKALALFQWKQDFNEAEELCKKALIIDPECDIAVATMAQLLLQQGKVTEALEYFERAAELSRTEGEIVNALSYAEATRTQLEVQEKYPQLATRLQGMGAGITGPAR